MQVTVVEGDLLDQKVDAIVNAWNRNIIPWWLLIPHGVSGAIKKRGGLKPFIEVGAFGPIPLGHAVHTSAGRLNYKAIIHVAGIDMKWSASEYSIANSVRNAMKLAAQLSLRSVAFPIIGAGAGSFKEDGAFGIMLDTFSSLHYDNIDVIVVRYKRF
ncbi:MAG: macro domain-containing protein [Candidatus Obscuribacterales bacterium]|nr:macro domain-containing protein [Candidatus Obscuribacterales bacterium]